VDDSERPDSADFFRAAEPKRLYAESQLAYAMAEGLVATMKGWIRQAFDPAQPRHPLVEADALVAKGGEEGDG
jgi:hypothetical protein